MTLVLAILLLGVPAVYSQFIFTGNYFSFMRLLLCMHGVSDCHSLIISKLKYFTQVVYFSLTKVKIVKLDVGLKKKHYEKE